MSTNNPKKTSENLDGKRSALVIEDDEQFADLLKDYLEEHPAFGRIEFATDGLQGIELARTMRPDLVVLDWRLPKMSGLVVFNRLQDLPAPHPGILIASGLLDPDDLRLIAEHRAVRSIQKPFSQEQFEEKASEVMLEQDFVQHRTAEATELLAAAAQDPQKALKGLFDILGKSQQPIPLGLDFARIARSNGEFEVARNLIAWVLKKSPDNAVALFELGRVLYALKQPQEALRALARAQALSPKNIARMKLIGTANLHTLNANDASKAFQQILKVDPTDEVAKAGVAAATMLKERPEGEKPAPGSDGQAPSFASIANMMGITAVAAGRHAEGIERYKSALDFLTDPEEKARVLFNIGLGFVRWQKPDSAATWFEKAVEVSGGKFSKAGRYLNVIQGKVIAAAKRGEVVPENLSTVEATEPVDIIFEDDDAPSAPQAAPASMAVSTNSRTITPAQRGKASGTGNRPPIPLPEPLPRTEVLQAIRDAVTAAQQAEKRLSEAPKGFARLRALICHPAQGGWMRHKRELAALGFSEIETCSNSAEAHAIAKKSRIHLVVAWHQEDARNNMLDLVEELLEDESIGRFGLLLQCPGANALSDLQMRSGGVLAERALIVQWARSRFQDDVRSTLAAASAPSAAGSLLARVRAAAQKAIVEPATIPGLIEAITKISGELGDRNKSRWFELVRIELLAVSTGAKAASAAASRLIEEHASFVPALILEARLRAEAGEPERLMALPERLKVLGKNSPMRMLRVAQLLHRFQQSESLYTLLELWNSRFNLPADHCYHFAGSLHYKTKPYESSQFLAHAVHAQPLRADYVLAFANSLLDLRERSNVVELADLFRTMAGADPAVAQSLTARAQVETI